MQVNNNLHKNIDIKIHNGTEQTKTVAARTLTITDFLIQSRYQPDDIFVYGVLTGTTDIVYLNNKPELTIQPSIARHTHIINTGGDSGSSSIFLSNVNKLKVLEVYILAVLYIVDTLFCFFLQIGRMK